jgi:hypothetical protein
MIVGTTDPFPLMPPRSTEARLAHFDEYVYTATPDTNLYKFVDALCGTTGAGSLTNQVFLARLGGALQTVYFNELDYIFGKINFLARSPAESYPWNGMLDQLTSDQWDEIRVKDAWYRARIVDFFQACNLGGTPNGIRMTIQAAVGVDCDIYEVWRYRDNYGLTADLGRAPTPTVYVAVNLVTGAEEIFETEADAATYVAANGPPWSVQQRGVRNEVAIRPYKNPLAPEEIRLCRDMLDKIGPIDVIFTVNANGLAVNSPIPVQTAASDSTYYQVEKKVTATPILAQLPPPEMLPIDLLPSETWLYDAQSDPTLAPYTAFNISAEFGYYYLVGGGKRSPIDSVTYGTIDTTNADPMSTYRTEANFQVFNETGQYTATIPFETADSPDNYPGGKYGIHPQTPPALNPDGTPYVFPYTSQADYVDHKTLQVLALGGQTTPTGYQLPVQTISSAAMVFTPDLAIAYYPPAKESTISVSITRQRSDPTGMLIPEPGNPVNFVRTS